MCCFSSFKKVCLSIIGTAFLIAAFVMVICIALSNGRLKEKISTDLEEQVCNPLAMKLHFGLLECWVNETIIDSKEKDGPNYIVKARMKMKISIGHYIKKKKFKELEIKDSYIFFKRKCVYFKNDEGDWVSKKCINQKVLIVDYDFDL